MSSTPPRRAVPRGHGLYLRVLDSLPPRCAASLRTLATLRRRGRSELRRSLRRVRRRLGRWQRRASARSKRWLQTSRWRGLRQRMMPQHTDRGSEDTGWRSHVLRLVFPPTLDLPGDGPVTAVDARGISSDEILQHLDRYHHRTVFVVDDPNVAALRARGVSYDYAPTTAEVSPDERFDWTIGAFGASRTVRFERSDGG